MYAIFLDIDGTIFSNNEVSEGVRAAIAAAQSAGHKVFINTARGFVGMPEQIYKMSFDGFVNSFGSEVCVDGKFIHRKFIPTERAIGIAKFAFENGVSLCLEGEVRMDINRTVADSKNLQSFEAAANVLKEKRVCKLVVDTRFSEQQKADLFPEFTFHGTEVIYNGYDKAFGIKLIQEHLGIDRKNTVAIGDSGADISMIDYAGIGISMGNGTEDLKKCAKYITRSCSQDGVAFAIECLLDGDISPLIKKDCTNRF